MANDLHPDVAALAHLLRRIADLIIPWSPHWAGEITTCMHALENSDAWGLHRFLGSFGGMGSFDDLVLQRDGVVPGPENVRLNALREAAWQLASRLKPEL